jgi:hypothetical protein
VRCGNQNKMDKTKTDDARKHIPWRYDNTIYLKSSDNSDGPWSELTWFETTVLISKTLWQHFGLSLPNYDIILFNLFPFSPCVLIAHSWMPLDNVLAQGQGSGGITLNPCSKWLSPVKKNHFLLYNRLAYWNQTWWGCSLSIFLFGFLFVYLFVDFLM